MDSLSEIFKTFTRDIINGFEPNRQRRTHVYTPHKRRQKMNVLQVTQKGITKQLNILSMTKQSITTTDHGDMAHT